MMLTGLPNLFIVLKMDVALWGIGLDCALIALLHILGMRVATVRRICAAERENEKKSLQRLTRRANAPLSGIKGCDMLAFVSPLQPLPLS